MKSPIVLQRASESLRLRASRWFPLVFALIALISSASAQLSVPLTVQEALYQNAPTSGINRTQDPVTVGVPLPDSAGIANISQLGLSGASIGQFRVLGRWPSGNIKWVLIDTQADVPAGGQNTAIALTNGSGNFGGPNLATDNGANISINTGVAQFVIRKAHFNLFDQVVVSGKTIVSPATSSGLVLMGPAPGATTCGNCTNPYTSSNDPNSTAVIEENGPARSVVKVTGSHVDANGNVYMHYTVRMHFYHNKPFAKVQVTLRNADETNNPSGDFNSAYKGFASYEARVTPNLGSSRSFKIGTDSNSSASGQFTGGENAYLYQAYSDNMEVTDWRNTPNCQNPNNKNCIASYIARTPNQGGFTYSQDGYQIVHGNGILAQGDHTKYPQGWADLSDANGNGIEVGVYQLSGYWPKSLQLNGGGSEVRVGIWPDQSLFHTGGGQPYYQGWPQYSIHDLFFDFHSSTLASPADTFLSFQHYLLARAPVNQYNQAKVFPYPLLDPVAEDNFYRSNSITCCMPDLAPRIFRFYAWGQAGGGNQHELRWSYLRNFLERGEPGRYLFAAHFYRMEVEEAFPRSDGFSWRSHPLTQLDHLGFPAPMASANSTLAIRNWTEAEHAHWYGLTDYYFLTGDEAVKDQLLDGVKDGFLNAQARVNNGTMWDSREVGERLMSIARLYQTFNAFNDPDAPTLLPIADSILNTQVFPEMTASGFGDAPQGVSRVRGVRWGCCSRSHEPPNYDGRELQAFQEAIFEEGLWEVAQARGPAWNNYTLAMDLAYGDSQWAMTEGYGTAVNESPTYMNTGFRYIVFLDMANAGLSYYDRPGATMTNWFHFYTPASYAGDLGWQQKFVWLMKRMDRNYPYPWAEVGSHMIQAVVDKIINPPQQQLITVPVNANNNGGGSYTLTWTVPNNPVRYRIKYAAGKEIVDWIGFDAAHYQFIGNPNTNEAWFAATDVPNPPQPGPPNTIQHFTVTGLDPNQTFKFALKAYVGSDGGGGDNQPPSVTITSPAQNAIVSGTISLAANATDNVAVAWVQFEIDGNPVGSHLTHTPYTLPWDTTTVSNGIHTITALASDTTGNLGSASEQVTVTNGGGNNPPVVTITSPGNDSTVSGTITIAANATSQNGIAWVSFKVDGTSIGNQITNPPYSMQWNSATVPDGNHVITATASDRSGQQASATVRVQTRNGGQNPSVTITTPHTGDTVSGQVNVTASVVNLRSFALVFRVDTQTIGTLVSNGNSTYTLPWDTTHFTDGSHTVSVTAVLSAVTTATPLVSSVTVTVNNGGNQNPPQVTITSPTTMNVSRTVLFAANAISNYGIAKVQFYQDNALLQTVTTPPYQMSWNTIRVKNGAHTLTAAATDTRGTVGQATKAVNVLNTDNSPPSATVTSPQNNAQVSGSIQLNANASDNNGVFAVEFLVDGNYVGGQLTTPPYTIGWDSHSVSNGAHRITARAWDFVGNQADSSPIAITVSNTGGQQGWTKQEPSWDSHFGYRSWNQLVYDSIGRKVLAWVAVSGCGDPWSQALWAYDTTTSRFIRRTWSGAGAVENGNCVQPIYIPNPPNHPGDRHPYHQMTYDTNRGRMWMFSGVADRMKCDNTGPGNCDFKDMWYYDSTNHTWTCTDTGGGCNAEETTMYSPGNRQEGAMTYDPVNDVVILFGGLTHGNQTNNTWQYSPASNSWTLVYDNDDPASPPRRNGDSMVYDSTNHKIVMFGGLIGRQPANDIWLYDAATKVWTNPQPPVSPPSAKFPMMAYDSTRNQVVYYAGPDNTWAYNVASNQWRNLNIAGGPANYTPSEASMAYDPSTDTFVVLSALAPGEVWHLKLR